MCWRRPVCSRAAVAQAVGRRPCHLLSQLLSHHPSARAPLMLCSAQQALQPGRGYSPRPAPERTRCRLKPAPRGSLHPLSATGAVLGLWPSSTPAALLCRRPTGRPQRWPAQDPARARESATRGVLGRVGGSLKLACRPAEGPRAAPSYRSPAGTACSLSLAAAGAPGLATPKTHPHRPARSPKPTPW